jgi:hypothetical protein
MLRYKDMWKNVETIPGSYSGLKIETFFKDPKQPLTNWITT